MHRDLSLIRRITALLTVWPPSARTLYYFRVLDHPVKRLWGELRGKLRAGRRRGAPQGGTPQTGKPSSARYYAALAALLSISVAALPFLSASQWTMIASSLAVQVENALAYSSAEPPDPRATQLARTAAADDVGGLGSPAGAEPPPGPPGGPPGGPVEASRQNGQVALLSGPLSETEAVEPPKAAAPGVAPAAESFEWIDLLAKEADRDLDGRPRQAEETEVPEDPFRAEQASASAPEHAGASAGEATEGPPEAPLSEVDALAERGGPGTGHPGSPVDLLPAFPGGDVEPAEDAAFGPPRPDEIEAEDGGIGRAPLTAERVIDLPDPPEGALPEPITPGEAMIEIPELPRSDLSLSVGKGRLIRLSRLIDKVLLADPSVADVHVVSPRLIYVFGSKVGQTDLFALAADGDVVAFVDLAVAPDVDVAGSRIEERYPGSTARLDALGGKVVASGEVGSFAEAYDVAALAQGLAPEGIPPYNRTAIDRSQQVNLRVRFAEVRRNDIYRLGINWQALIERGDFLVGLATGNFAVVGSEVGDETFATAFGSFDSGSVELDVVIDALQREGIVNILAEPNLTALNGEAASFLAGGEFPFPVPSGNGDVTIQFREFGVSLSFLPTLLGDDRIAIQVRPEVSQINFGSGFAIDGFVVPLLTVRRTETTVELNSGQTFALAGLFQRNVTDDLDKFPFLADIPILGKLFQSVRYQQEETELVILITPYLVNPVSDRERMALPGAPPEGMRLPHRKPPRSPVDDTVGFIID